MKRYFRHTRDRKGSVEYFYWTFPDDIEYGPVTVHYKDGKVLATFTKYTRGLINQNLSNGAWEEIPAAEAVLMK